MRIESVNVGRAATVTLGSRVIESGIRKTSVDVPVQVTAEGVQGDVVVDTEHHGGRDQAVYAYSADDYDWWCEHLGRRIDPGTFGENLTIRDMPSDLRIGDRLLIGELVLEATAPRIPCDTLAAHMGDSGFGLAFRRAERPGIYFRVLNEGAVRRGDVVTLVGSDECDVTTLELFRYKYRLSHEPNDLRRLLEAPLAERFRASIEKKLAAADKKTPPSRAG